MNAVGLAANVEAFLRARQAMGATPATLRTYAWVLERFLRDAGLQTLDQLTPEALEEYLGRLLTRMKPVSAHQHYRVLRTFTRWLYRTGRISADPMAGVSMRCPRTLPRVPSEEDVRKLLDACGDSFEGRRNRAMVALLADSGLRKEELRRLRVGDVNLPGRTLRVWQGKGRRDRVGFFGEATASILRAWLAVHPNPEPASPLFVTQAGAQLGPWAVTRVLHRLSKRAGLQRRIGAHTLRHFAATALLRRSGDLELVRRVLGHSTLTMALRYATLADAEVQLKYAHASPLDHLRPVRTR